MISYKDFVLLIMEAHELAIVNGKKIPLKNIPLIPTEEDRLRQTFGKKATFIKTTIFRDALQDDGKLNLPATNGKYHLAGIVGNTELHVVSWWFNNVINRQSNRFKDAKFSEMYSIAKEEHDKLMQAGGKVIDEYEENEDNVFLDYRDENGLGFYWVDLETTSCSEEGSRMGHCGHSDRADTLYSLRSFYRQGVYIKNESHITAAIGSNGTIYQMKGKENSKPKEEYHGYIVDLLTTNKTPIKLKRVGYEYESDNDFKVDDLSMDLFNKVIDKNPSIVVSTPEGLYFAYQKIPNFPIEDHVSNLNIEEDYVEYREQEDYFIELVNPDDELNIFYRHLSGGERPKPDEEMPKFELPVRLFYKNKDRLWIDLIDNYEKSFLEYFNGAGVPVKTPKDILAQLESGKHVDYIRTIKDAVDDDSIHMISLETTPKETLYRLLDSYIVDVVQKFPFVDDVEKEYGDIRVEFFISDLLSFYKKRWDGDRQDLARLILNCISDEYTGGIDGSELYYYALEGFPEKTLDDFKGYVSNMDERELETILGASGSLDLAEIIRTGEYNPRPDNPDLFDD